MSCHYYVMYCCRYVYYCKLAFKIKTLLRLTSTTKFGYDGPYNIDHNFINVPTW